MRITLDDVGPRRDLDRADARGAEFRFGNRDEPVLVHRVPAVTDRGVPEPGIDPALDIVLERHDGAGRAENQEEERRDEPEIQVDCEDRPIASRDSNRTRAKLSSGPNSVATGR